MDVLIYSYEMLSRLSLMGLRLNIARYMTWYMERALQEKNNSAKNDQVKTLVDTDSNPLWLNFLGG